VGGMAYGGGGCVGWTLYRGGAPGAGDGSGGPSFRWTRPGACWGGMMVIFFSLVEYLALTLQVLMYLPVSLDCFLSGG